MARRPREDAPGSWHHVVNRGIGKRALFESTADARYFLARLVRQVRAGRVEVHAYCLMTTHFHLLLRSPVGELSEAMRCVQNEHSRRFNRRHARDGSLVRGRFFSRPVHSLEYRRAVVRYIDRNPVSARVARRVGEYSLCSAAHYARERLPRWLADDWIRSEMHGDSSGTRVTARDYAATFHPASDGDEQEVMEFLDSRLAFKTCRDELPDLVAAAPDAVQAWMQRKAKLADGTRVGVPVCGALALRRTFALDLDARGEWIVDDRDRVRRGAQVALLGMLHDLCGRSWHALAQSEGISVARARRLGVTHRRLLVDDAAYAERCSRIAHRALGRSVGAASRRPLDPRLA